MENEVLGEWKTAFKFGRFMEPRLLLLLII